MAHGIPTSTADFARKIPRYSRRYNKTASTLYRDLAQQHQKNSLTLFALKHFFADGRVRFVNWFARWIHEIQGGGYRILESASLSPLSP